MPNYYDQIAPIYDRSRWLTASIAAEVANSMVNFVGAAAKTRFLEPGVGTGLADALVELEIKS